jgi:hypothetical protein
MYILGDHRAGLGQAYCADRIQQIQRKYKPIKRDFVEIARVS